MREVMTAGGGSGEVAVDPEAAISVRHLRKSYGALVAVQDVDLDVQHGEIVALLGPNGAGKTSIVEILEGYRERTLGAVHVLGEDPANAPLLWRDRLGIVLQDSDVEPDLTVRECLELYAGFYLHPRSPMETLELVGLAEKAATRGSRLSGGQRRRLDVALALIGDPELVFLDEPTTGFDPSARRQAWGVIEGLRSLGKTVLLTTHYMDEAEHLADRIVVLARGGVVAQGPPRTLAGREARPATITFTIPLGASLSELPAPLLMRADVQGDRDVVIVSDQSLADVAALATWAEVNGVELRDLEVKRPAIEDIYLELTAEPAEPGANKEGP